MNTKDSTKGKNFSCNNATGKRRKSDFYETPYSLTLQLLDCEEFDTDKSILEPAAGNGAIVRVLSSRNFRKIKSYDKECDFLAQYDKHSFIITNPPFSLSHQFILHAKKVCTNKFAFLLPLSYLHGKSRYETVYSDTDFPLKAVYVFTRYPMLGEELRKDGKYKTGMMVYAWFVWDKEWKGEPFIRWIDNNEYVLSAKDRDA